MPKVQTFNTDELLKRHKVLPEVKDGKRYVSVNDARKVTGYTDGYIRAMTCSGTAAFIKFGASIFVDIDELMTRRKANDNRKEGAAKRRRARAVGRHAEE